MATRAALAGLLIIAAGCGAAAQRPSRQQRVLGCLHANGWVTQSRPSRDSLVLAAANGHATVELFFWPNAAAARRAVPDLAPLGVGWGHNISFRSSYGFTYADEQTVERCL
jgi:hypothetical protein